MPPPGTLSTLATIPFVQPVTVPVRLPSSRLWDLVRREKHGVITAAEQVELECLLEALEATQDNEPLPPGDSATA